MELANKTVLVTGAGSGIGRLLAMAAAGRGAEVVIWDLNAERVANVQAELEASGRRVRTGVVDVTDSEAVRRQAESTGPVDVLINNAGVVGGRPLLDENDAAIRRTIAVNLESQFWVTRAFLGGMLERDSGYVVNIASAAGIVANARMTDYAASKFGSVGFSDALRRELRHTGVRTMVVLPFYTNTGMFAGVKLKQPELLALLKPEHVAAQVILGIERNASELLLPRAVWLARLFRLLPNRLCDAAVDWMGLNESMDTFTGRSTDRV